MYHALLTNRYLTTRVIPFIAVAAVALCTALVIIVISVMSGFVDMVKNAGKTLMGDVVISYPLRGIPHYEELIREIDALPESKAATPVVEAYGLLKMPYPMGDNKETHIVQVWGIEPDSFAKITGYTEALHWKTPDDKTFLTALRAVSDEIWNYRGPGESRFFDPQTIERVSSRTDDIVRRVLLAFGPIANERAILNTPEAELRTRLPDLLSSERTTEDGRTVRDIQPWLDLLNREPLLIPGKSDLLNLGLEDVYDAGLHLRDRMTNDDAIVIGMHVSQGNERRSDGTYRILGQGMWWMPQHQVTLTMLPISSGGKAREPETQVFRVANEAAFGVFAIDDKRVFVPLRAAQRMLELDEADYVPDPDDLDPGTMLPRVEGTVPARAILVLVGAADGVSPTKLKARVEQVYDDLQLRMQRDGEQFPLPDREFGVSIRTWEEQNAEFIAPVEKERNLMRILFSIVYVVCAGLVLVIFWAIVFEKTRDIGILRSIGASRLGILWIFVRYGFVVGLIGSMFGLAIAWIVVHNINLIHEALGHPFSLTARITAVSVAAACLVGVVIASRRDAILPVIALSLISLTMVGITVWMHLHQGFLVWDPRVYYFDTIPNRVDSVSAITTMAGATVFSVIGALIPAARAGDVNPVAALRYE